MASFARALLMNCQYCGTGNAIDDERCARCGRRLQLANPKPAPDGYRPYAVALKPVTHSEQAIALETPPVPAKPQPARQSPLFTSSESPRVVPIFGPSITPRKPAPANRPKVVDKKLGEKKTANSSLQQQLAFGPALSSPRRATTEIESEIYCSAPVATTQHRVVAAFIDSGIVLTALAVLLAVFSLWGHGSFGTDPISLSIGGCLAVMVIGFYQILWVLANGDSAGLRMAQLTLVDFDGRRPSRKQRFARIASCWLSIAPGALGLFWALVDEEKLTWHDQISKTFPSPIAAQKN